MEREKADVEQAIARLRQGIANLNREGRKRLRRLQEAIIEGGDAPTPTSRRTFLDIVLVLMLSLLGFVLLFALVEWTSR